LWSQWLFTIHPTHHKQWFIVQGQIHLFHVMRVIKLATLRSVMRYIHVQQASKQAEGHYNRAKMMMTTTTTTTTYKHNEESSTLCRCIQAQS
jgi:hypothetical protein